MDMELVSELKKSLAKYWHVMALPAAEKAPYAAGIGKLEIRVEQLRAATGMDTDQFVSRAREIMRLLYGDEIPMATMDDAVFAKAAECLDRAGTCFRIGDQPGVMAAFSDLEQYAQETIRMPKQEVLPL